MLLLQDLARVRADLREDLSILNLIDADFTFVNERLARHYGISDINGTSVGKKTGKRGQATTSWWP